MNGRAMTEGLMDQHRQARVIPLKQLLRRYKAPDDHENEALRIARSRERAAIRKLRQVDGMLRRSISTPAAIAAAPRGQTPLWLGPYGEPPQEMRPPTSQMLSRAREMPLPPPTASLVDDTTTSLLRPSTSTTATFRNGLMRSVTPMYLAPLGKLPLSRTSLGASLGRVPVAL